MKIEINEELGITLIRIAMVVCFAWMVASVSSCVEQESVTRGIEMDLQSYLGRD